MDTNRIIKGLYEGLSNYNHFLNRINYQKVKDVEIYEDMGLTRINYIKVIVEDFEGKEEVFLDKKLPRENEIYRILVLFFNEYAKRRIEQELGNENNDEIAKITESPYSPHELSFVADIKEITKVEGITLSKKVKYKHQLYHSRSTNFSSFYINFERFEKFLNGIKQDITNKNEVV